MLGLSLLGLTLWGRPGLTLLSHGRLLLLRVTRGGLLLLLLRRRLLPSHGTAELLLLMLSPLLLNRRLLRRGARRNLRLALLLSLLTHGAVGGLTLLLPLTRPHRRGTALLRLLLHGARRAPPSRRCRSRSGAGGTAPLHQTPGSALLLLLLV